MQIIPRLFSRAAALLADGHWAAAARLLEDLSLQYPLDLVALQVGHQLDSFTGDARMLRDRIARAVAELDVAPDPVDPEKPSRREAKATSASAPASAAITSRADRSASARGWNRISTGWVITDRPSIGERGRA